jgi:hypothetical protein
MFEYFKELKFKSKLKKDFLKEHEKYLPKFSPQGQPLEWHIFIYGIIP